MRLKQYSIAVMLVIVFGFVGEIVRGQSSPGLKQYSSDYSEWHIAAERRYSQICNSWVGSDINELIIKWGVPERIKIEGSGQIFVYIDFKDFLGQQLNCTTQFRTNKQGVIISFKWEGNGCWGTDSSIGR